jgi:hypothetical protein
MASWWGQTTWAFIWWVLGRVAGFQLGHVSMEVYLMGLRVSTNVQSLAAQRNLGINNAAQQASLEKLASGSRITRAADDAAGLAVSEKMRGQIRSVRQDIRNAGDGISMIQTRVVHSGSLGHARRHGARFYRQGSPTTQSRN